MNVNFHDRAPMPEEPLPQKLSYIPRTLTEEERAEWKEKLIQFCKDAVEDAESALKEALDWVPPTTKPMPKYFNPGDEGYDSAEYVVEIVSGKIGANYNPVEKSKQSS